MAISKQRLKELIEQGATIYGVDKRNLLNHTITPDTNIKELLICEIILNDDMFIIDDTLCQYDWNLQLKYLFEAKERAEFAAKYKRIPRTEYLDLPDWEEFNKNSYFQFVSKDMSNIVLADSSYLEIDEYIDGEFVQTYFHKEMNKENYTEACDLCKKLFLGEI